MQVRTSNLLVFKTYVGVQCEEIYYTRSVHSFYCLLYLKKDKIKTFQQK